MSTKAKLILTCAADIDCTPPKYPRVVTSKKTLYLEVAPELDYEIPDHPVKVLGLLHHLSGKMWTDDGSGFFFHAIERIAKAKGWKIHPFQGGETGWRGE